MKKYIMKRKINNPFTRIEEYNCFGCSPKNPKGLHMTFFEEGEEIVSEWLPESYYQGYGNVLHGGVISTLMDEIASWYIFTKLKSAGVTYQLQCDFLAPVYTDRGSITLRAILKEQRRRKTDIDVKLYDHEGNLCAQGNIGYLVFPKKFAKEKLYYPDFDSFFED